MVICSSPATRSSLSLTSIIISCLVFAVSSSKCSTSKSLLRSRDLTYNIKSNSGRSSLFKNSRVMLKAWYSRPTPFRLGDDMDADSPSGGFDNLERRMGGDVIPGEQTSPPRMPSSSSGSSTSRSYRFKLRSASSSRRRVQIRNADQSDGGAALPAEGSSTRTKDDIAAEAGAKARVGFFPRMSVNESGPSRIRAWRMQQCLSWDLSKIEPLQRDKETNRTRILAFSPQIELLDNLENGNVDMERVELRQERDYLNFMEKIKDFNPHILAMDYEECNIGLSKDSRGKMEAEPVIEAIQQAIDDGEINPQYFIILGDLPTFSKHAALEYVIFKNR